MLSPNTPPAADDTPKADAAEQASAQRAPLRDDLRQTILQRIVRGELPAGARINESRLATELGVSRTPLREALFHLERDGFVRSDLARGFSVADLSPREVREVYPILETLECLALRSSGALACVNIDELRTLNAEFAAVAGDSARCIEIDADWHSTLLARCPNQRLLALITNLKYTILRYEHLYMLDAALVARSVAQHNAVIAALEANDMDAAVEALRTNWRFSLDTLLLRIGEP